ncbi:hypothetical protein NQ317_001896 [Molorchus minor]|uniref:Uncharacterized protein n=1 Tax=Molorchus minor TaxID=1323400 RepID=A0ABQ9IRM5_9CUCU|nr:hypothetical protein NQ317_001896 [Molorchus minor]
MCESNTNKAETSVETYHLRTIYEKVTNGQRRPVQGLYLQLRLLEDFQPLQQNCCLSLDWRPHETCLELLEFFQRATMTEESNDAHGYAKLGRSRRDNSDYHTRGVFTNLSPPIDAYNAVYLAFVLGGAGFLLPYNSIMEFYIALCERAKTRITLEPTEDAGLEACKQRWEVTKAIYPYMISICLVYFATLCLYPGIASEVMMASSARYWTGARLVRCSVARLITVPLMVMCGSTRGNPIFAAEITAFTFSLFFGTDQRDLGILLHLACSAKHRESDPSPLRDRPQNMVCRLITFRAQATCGCIPPGQSCACGVFQPTVA